MGIFAHHLKELVEKSGISVQRVASLCGIERTYLHKMLSGERLCPDRETIDRIARVLMLDYQQTKQLQEQYLIARMGEEVYSRHQLVKSLIESFDNPVIPRGPWVKSMNIETLEFIGEVKPIQGTEAVNHFLKAIIEEEAEKENGIICLMAQPEYAFLTELLAHIGQSKQGVSIIHLLCLQRNISERSENRYNLELISQIVPLIISVCNYQPHYYYDDVQAHINTTSILPYLIVTANYAMSISNDASSALLFQSSELREFYLNQFERILSQAQPMIKRINNPLFVQQSPSPEDSNNFPGYSMSVEPCMGHFISKDIISRYMSPNLPESNAIITWFEHLDNYITNLPNNSCYRVSIFLADGLDSFIQSGRVREIPPALYSPLERMDSYRFLRILYEQSLLGGYLPVIINPQVFKLPRNLILTSTTPSDNISFFYISPVHGMITFNFYERSITHAIISFFLFLKDSEYVLSHEETMAIIRAKVTSMEQEMKLPLEQRIQ